MILTDKEMQARVQRLAYTTWNSAYQAGHHAAIVYTLAHCEAFGIPRLYASNRPYAPL